MNNYIYAFVLAVVIFGMLQYYVNNYVSDEYKSLFNKDYYKIYIFCGLLLLSYGIVYFISTKFDLNSLNKSTFNMFNLSSLKNLTNMSMSNNTQVATSNNGPSGPSLVALSTSAVNIGNAGNANNGGTIMGNSANSSILDDKLSLDAFENELINSIKNQEVDVGLVPF